MPEQFRGRKDPFEAGDKCDPPRYTPYLNIRYDMADTGDRPLGPGTVYFVSPDILVSPTDGLGNVVVGTDVTIQARVFNRGLKSAILVNVTFWVFNPSFVFTSANSIFSATIPKTISVPPLNYADVVCPTPWIPTFVNGGHECIVVQCNTPEEGTDGLRFPFFPALDRHVGQRNITVANPQAGQQLQMLAGNPFARPLSCTLRLSSLLVHGNFATLRKDDLGTLMALLAQAQVGSVPRSLGKHRLEMRVEDISERNLGVRLLKIGNQTVPGDHKPVMPFDTFLLQRTGCDPDFNPQGLGRILGEFAVEPGRTHTLVIEVPPINLGNNAYIVHHFTQVAENCEVGGYTLVVPPQNF